MNVGRRLAGKVAIVTAGTNGIGLAISKRLALEGAHVVVSSRKKENVDRAEQEIRDMGLQATGIVCHVGNTKDRLHLIERTATDLGKINIFVQNAGVNPHPKNIMDTPESALDKIYHIHIKSNFQFVQEITPYMERNEEWSSILLTSSISGHRADVFSGAYAITKASIFSMVKAFMPEMTARKIRINCLSLGVIDTDFLSAIKANEHVREHLIRNIPLGRFGRPEECAGLASFLCSDDASYITGETFTISGGGYTGL